MCHKGIGKLCRYINFYDFIVTEVCLTENAYDSAPFFISKYKCNSFIVLL